MAYYATYDTITTADKSNDPAWVEITEAHYLFLLDGMMNGYQVYIRSDRTAALRWPEPWDYDGTNYIFNEDTNEWEPVIPTEPEVPIEEDQ